MGKVTRYTEAQLAFIKANCTLTRAELAKRFNAKFERQVTAVQVNSLCKRKGWLTGRDGRFQKGDVSWNKGKKGYIGANKTSFQKGHKPANWLPVGSECVKGDGYLWVKIAEPNKWKQKHRILWEFHHGEIPENHVIIFRDNNRENCCIENLAILTRAELTVMNRHFQRDGLIDDEAHQAIITMARIKTKVGQIKKQAH